MPDRANTLFSPFWRQLLTSLAVLLLLLLAFHFLLQTEQQRLEQDLRAHVAEEALATAALLETEINANVYLANGMVALLNTFDKTGPDQINTALHHMYRFGRHLRNIGVAPGNRLTYVYPLESNEAAIGLYYPDLPNQWSSVKRAIETRNTILAGPITLKQGGKGLISRTPVFLDDGHYWGILSLVLDSDSLFNAAGVKEENNDVSFAIRGKNGLGSEGEIFFGNPELFEADPFTLTIRVPGGEWLLAALPKDGWQANTQHLMALRISALALAIFMAAITFAFQRGRLQIISSERRLRTFLDTTHDGVIVINGHSIIQEFNPAAEELFGYAAEEVVGNSINRLMPEADAVQHDHHVTHSERSDSHEMAIGRVINGRRKDGSLIPLEITVGHTHIADTAIHVGVVRDITERIKLENQLKALANTDTLTGLYNRRAFLERGEAVIQLATRYQHPVSMLMIDADHFKKINDGYGHQTGDAVLVKMAKIMKQTLRTSDILGRFGGEEFIALLPESDASAARESAERLLQAIRAADIELDNGERLQFTVSIGIDTDKGASLTMDHFIQRADQALYQAKAAGRNRWQRFERDSA